VGSRAGTPHPRNGRSTVGHDAWRCRLVGVADPERVRLLCVPEIPIPDDPALSAAVEETQFLSSLTRGLTLRYGIFIRADCKSDRTMVIHELGHTAQYERLGGFEPFLRRYLLSVLLSATLKHRWSKR